MGSKPQFGTMKVIGALCTIVGAVGIFSSVILFFYSLRETGRLEFSMLVSGIVSAVGMIAAGEMLQWFPAAMDVLWDIRDDLRRQQKIDGKPSPPIRKRAPATVREDQMKVAFGLFSDGNDTQAIEMFQSIRDRYPNTPEGQKSKEILDSLGL